mmetsp:Transcript_17332/g.38914  ORF Transcript_17332/g.38914 Transcript_17332/m.38914 type:complete len:205 (-) Transcript_17332:256-870(-)
MRSSSSCSVIRESSRAFGTIVERPASISLHCAAPSASRASSAMLQYLPREVKVTGVEVPPSKSSARVPSLSAMSNELKMRSANEVWSTPSSSMWRSLRSELNSAKSNSARSGGERSMAARRFHTWGQSCRSRTSSCCSSAQPISLPRKKKRCSSSCPAAAGRTVNEDLLLPIPCWPLGQRTKRGEAADCSSAQTLVMASRYGPP